MIEEDEPTGKARGGHARAERLPPERRREIAKQAAEARWKAEPLNLIEDAETGDQFVLYVRPDGAQFELRFKGEEPWATQKQMADLFGIDVKTVNQHLRHIFADGELDKMATISKCEIVQTEGERTVRREVAIYSLDCILAVGYRATSREAIIFRRWATDILRQYLIYGFAIDQPRLQDPDGRPDYFEALLNKIRAIRASEKRMWTRLLELASFCSDYSMMNDSDRQDLFATFQNTMHWAVTQMTGAEIIHARVDASKRNCGLTTFVGDLPTVKEAQVAKNLLSENEIETLNLVTSLALEFFESQAEQRRPMTICQFIGKMYELLKLDGRPVLRSGNKGSISMATAKEKASQEIKKFKERIRIERELEGERKLLEIARTAKARAARKRP